MSIHLTCAKCGAGVEVHEDGMPFVQVDHASIFILLWARGKACNCNPLREQDIKRTYGLPPADHLKLVPAPVLDA